MSSFDKIVKLACKPKGAPPKAKYIDPIIAATWSDDGAVSDVCKALVPRIREPNHIVVFKALIVLHTMIRNGSTDNVLSYLSQADILRLKNVSAGSWEGYSAPENLQHYATYLESRIKAYRDLKHDAIRVQSDTNRDVRNSVSVDDELKIKKPRNQEAPAHLNRSKTLAGRKLRSMAVEKGLLRETRIVHGMIDTLVECRFYLDDLEDELNIAALRMLVKDLLILFQAGNEGVINVLEHYFEMSRIDAAEALKIYRHFCDQTEHVTEYLGVAKKLQNLLNIPIPNLKHAPISLASALQEYLDDPNFEANRQEYKQNKKAADQPTKRFAGKGEKTPKSPASVTFKDTLVASSSSAAGSSEPNGASTAQGKKDIIDFFDAIEGEQHQPSNPSPQVAIAGPGNPFSQMLGAQQFNGIPQINAQPTAFFLPQHTVTPANPFNNFLSVQPQQTGIAARPFSTFVPQQTGLHPQQPSPFMQQQHTGVPQFQQQPFSQQQTGLQPGFLQPQATGANPFRRSMLVPQTTGMALFANAQPTGNLGTLGQNLFANTLTTGQPPGSIGQNLFANAQPTGNSSSTFGQNLFNNPASSPSSAPIASSTPFSTNAFGQGSTSASAIAPAASSGFTSSMTPRVDVPNRPSSTPLTSAAYPGPAAQLVKTHQTGTKNPFGPVVTAQPLPVPKVPTLMDLAMGRQAAQSNDNNNLGQLNGVQQQQQQRQPQQQTGGFSWANSSLSPGASDISSIASSFTKLGQSSANLPSNASATQAGSPMTSAFSPTKFSSSSSSQPTGAAPLKSQITGFAGLKPFKPSSSFGAALMDSLPNAGGSNGTTPSATNGSTGASLFGSPAASSTLTNPASIPSNTGSFSPETTSPSSQQSTSTLNFGALNSQPTGGFTPTSSFGQSLGVGLRPQITGGGAANPFRASMAAGPTFGSGPSPPVPGLPLQFTGMPFGQAQQGQQPQFGGSTPFSGFNANQQNQPQNAPASLI